MKKSASPKTAFFKVTPDVDQAVVVEASSADEAMRFVASTAFVVEPYPTDKLIAFIKAGGEPVKVTATPKRKYVRKANGAAPAPTEPATA